MPTQHIHIPIVENSTQGALRWLSRKTQIPDLHGSNVVHVEADSIRSDTSISAPIGYNPTGNSYFVSGDDNESLREHWYNIDLLSFNIKLEGYTITREPIHYNKNWLLQVSTDCEEFTTVDNQTLNEQPLKWEFTSTLDSSDNARCIRIWTKSYRFDNETTLSIAAFDIFGSLTWYSSCTCKNTHPIHYSSFLISLLFSKR